MKGNDSTSSYQAVSYFANGTPVPDVMTEDEAITFLRLDDGTTKHPATTLEYYRSQGILKATRIGKKLRYLKSELICFLDIQTQRTSDNVS